MTEEKLLKEAQDAAQETDKKCGILVMQEAGFVSSDLHPAPRPNEVTNA